ncbi:MAG: hypothetical protein KAW88_03635 [Candidatus Cloacimonetes bacterium]|nr:hypothetical protein [Candidatus Cloacimonadota bacterium]
MKKKHIGLRYEYQIEVDFKINSFEIHSKHIEAGAVSTITNLNYILSEFASFCKRNDRIDDTTWIIKNLDTLEKLWKRTNESFEDVDFILSLEKELDIDRYYGGWNSGYTF